MLLLLLVVVVAVVVLSTEEVEAEMASTLIAAEKSAADMAMDPWEVTRDTTGVTETMTTEGADDMDMAEEVLEVEPG